MVEVIALNHRSGSADRPAVFLSAGFLLAACLSLSACQTGGEASYPGARYKGQTAPRYVEMPSAFGGTHANGTASAPPANAATDTHLGVNTYLWRAALEQVSYMPLISEDPVGGVIITDWYSAANAPNERFKLNVYIFGRDLAADSVRVSVYKQQRDPNGNWSDARAAATDGVSYQNAILARARQLNTAQATP